MWVGWPSWRCFPLPGSSSAWCCASCRAARFPADRTAWAGSRTAWRTCPTLRCRPWVTTSPPDVAALSKTENRQDQINPFTYYGWLVGWLCLSTARSFRDGTPIYSPLRRMWSSINTSFRPGIEPRAVAWHHLLWVIVILLLFYFFFGLNVASNIMRSYHVDKAFLQHWSHWLFFLFTVLSHCKTTSCANLSIMLNAKTYKVNTSYQV